MAVRKCAFQTVILLVLFASIEISVTQALEPGRLKPPFNINGCASAVCHLNSSCRVVLTANTSEPRIDCIRKELIDQGIDSECQSHRYLQVLLVEKSTTVYSQMTCTDNRDCLNGSVCVVDGLKEEGVCCTGNPDPDAEKNGTCPQVRQGEFSVCGGVFCDVDSDCPGAQKCCPGCGMRCTDPVLPPVCEPKCSPGRECTIVHPLCTSPLLCDLRKVLNPGTKCVDPSCDPVFICLPV